MDEKDLWILSYDVDGRERSTASRVCHLIFGRRNRTTKDGTPRTYDQPGFIARASSGWDSWSSSSHARTRWSSADVLTEWGSPPGWDAW